MAFPEDRIAHWRTSHLFCYIYIYYFFSLFFFGGGWCSIGVQGMVVLFFWGGGGGGVLSGFRELLGFVGALGFQARVL